VEYSEVHQEIAQRSKHKEDSISVDARRACNIDNKGLSRRDVEAGEKGGVLTSGLMV
jgi:hypothetical protein